MTVSARYGTGGNNVPFVVRMREGCDGGGMAAVTYAIDRASFNCGKNAQYDICIEEEKNSSLVAKGPSAVCCNVAHEGEPYYIVRRLTPTECGRLQGFPDFWCENLEITDITEKDISFWDGVFKTFGKPKTEKQIRKWLANPHSDSAEYKMWGNGCALPNVYYVLFGIKHFAEEE